MARRAMRLSIAAAIGVGVMVVLPGLCGGGPARAKALTADEVIDLWTPKLNGFTDYGAMGGSPKLARNVAAYTFRVVGPTFEEVWNHYADLCGMKQRYKEKSFLITADTGPNGSFVVSERASGDGKGDRGPSMFLLKTESYTVTVTFQTDPGGKSISGSLTAVVP